MRTQYGPRKIIDTVGELREFIEAVPDDVPLDLGFEGPVDILLMRDDETHEVTLSMDEDY